jgi:hypothetical protein
MTIAIPAGGLAACGTRPCGIELARSMIARAGADHSDIAFGAFLPNNSKV